MICHGARVPSEGTTGSRPPGWLFSCTGRSHIALQLTTAVGEGGWKREPGVAAKGGRDIRHSLHSDMQQVEGGGTLTISAAI